MQLIEQLETRRLLASFTAASVADLISDIGAANAAGGSNTITLAAGSTFKLNAVADNNFGATGLPMIVAGNDLTIFGNGDNILRSSTRGTPAFRLFEVDAGGALTLNNLTLSNGLAVNSNAPNYYSPEGGGIRSMGTLSLKGVTVENCIAQGQTGDWAVGGGIFSSGVLSIADSTIRNDQALGGAGYDPIVPGGSGGAAEGGGVYLGTGTASISNTTLSSNVARGGDGANGGMGRYFSLHFGIAGGPGGNAHGGAIYAGGSLELRGNTITTNSAQGGAGGNSPKGLAKGADGVGQGGGVYIYPTVSVSLDAFTQAHTSGNTASTSDNDIFGSFTILA